MVARADKKSQDKAGSGSKKRAKKAAPAASRLPPIRGGSKGRRSAAQSLILDAAEEDDDEGGDGEDGCEEYQGPVHANGYAKDDDEDDSIEPVRHGRAPPQQRQQTLEELGPPISRGVRLKEADEVHQDIVLVFVDEAKRLEEGLRNERSLRRPLFTERHFREMALRWTITLDQMKRIPDIDKENVSRHGTKLIPLVRQYHANYREMIGESAGHSRATGAAVIGPPRHQDIVNLISSDDEDYGELPDEDDAGPEALEVSKYFGGGRQQPGTSAEPSREIQA